MPARAGASLMPSPTIATGLRSWRSQSTSADLPAGSSPAWTLVIPGRWCHLSTSLVVPHGPWVPRCCCRNRLQSPSNGGAMSYARPLLDAYPGTLNADAGGLAAAIDALSDCAHVCTATVGVVSRQADYQPSVMRPLLEACVAICKGCGDECERHAQHHEHCRVCAQACRSCEQACRELLDALK